MHFEEFLCFFTKHEFVQQAVGHDTILGVEVAPVTTV